MADIVRIGADQPPPGGMDGPPPPGTLRVEITYLQMTARPPHRRLPGIAGRSIAFLRARKPTLSFYRYLYDTVGEPWLWWERRAMDQNELAAIVRDEKVEVYVIHADGVPAGYAEIDRRQGSDVELAYFGLIPDFIGQGLGRTMMACTLDAAWTGGTTRLWVHTCSLDHPQALAVYQRAGFVPYGHGVGSIPDPRVAGHIPAHVLTAEERQRRDSGA